MFEHRKTQAEKPLMPESGLMLDQIIHLHINFHRLAFTQGSSYIVLPEQIAKKKAMINPKNNEEHALNGLSLQYYIIKRLKKIINAYQSCSIMKTNITGTCLSFP